MFDIQFYAKFYDFRKRCQEYPDTIPTGKEKGEFLLETLESFRSKEPIVYNIETTNACNMRCAMCPRTTMMTRPVTQLSQEAFTNVVEQLKPFTQK